MKAANAVPYNQDAERSCLGAVFLAGADAFNRANLQAQDFYDPRNRMLWDAMGRLVNRAALDVVTLAAEMGERFAGIGGASYVSDVLSTVPTASNVEFYAALVRQEALRRRLIQVFQGLLGAARELEPEELLSLAYQQLGEVRLIGDTNGVQIGEAVKEVFRDLQKSLENGTTWGIPTGLPEVDKLLGGLHPGVVTVIAGRPSMGKSSIARTLCDGANKLGAGVHVFSCEDNRKAYALRAVSDHSRVSLNNLRTLQLNRGDMDALQYAADELYQRERWLISDHTGVSSADVALRVRREKEANQTRIVIVDYIQLLRERDVRRDNRKANVEIALENLLDLARREDIAVVVVSQLSRECERRDDKRPMLSDLRETGELEQCADIVLACYRDEYYDPDSEDKGVGELLVLKNKHGKTGQIRLAWDENTATFRPLARRLQSVPPERYADEEEQRG